jgi:predicted AAA+ superfamily ATPase
MICKCNLHIVQYTYPVIERDLEPVLRDAAAHYPVVTVIGPRQSGKTTLCRATFPALRYVSLEPLDERERARTDPRGFLEELRGGAILDEVQHVPELLSYLQADVDERPNPGRFVITGSHHLGVSGTVAQTLAGRTAILHLLPPSLAELRRFKHPPEGLFETLLAGAYPRIHDRGIPSDRWLADYVATYVQRDVRQILQLADLQTFSTFLRLCAGRTAQELSLSSLAGDVGVSHNTIRSWLSVLEASYLVIRTPAWHRSPSKRLVKAPKIHWLDSGLVCHLLAIRDAEQLRHHPLRGAVFESWVASEVYKAHVHRGLSADLYHVRQTRGVEIDLVVERGRTLTLVECKSGATLAGEFLPPLQRLAAGMLEGGDADRVRSVLVYGGGAAQVRAGVQILPWDAVPGYPWTGDAPEPPPGSGGS